MPHEWVDLDIEEVSAVDHPANKRTWLVVKAAKTEKMAETTEEIILREEAVRAWWQLWDAFNESISSILNDKTVDRPAMLQQTVEEFSARAKDILPETVEDAGVAKRLLAKAATLATLGGKVQSAPKVWAKAVKAFENYAATVIVDEEKEGQAVPTFAEMMETVPKEIKDAYEEGQRKIDELQAELEKSRKAPEPEDIWKGVSPEVRKRMEAMEARAEAAETLAKKERDDRVQHECIQKAASFSALQLTGDDDWQIFKAIGELPEGMGARIEQVLRGANEAVRQSGTFTPAGTSKGSEMSSAWDKLEAAASELMKADTKLTKAQAITKACEQNGELYDAYLVEKGGN